MCCESNTCRRRFRDRWRCPTSASTSPPGEVHALVGQNGSGKSTLIKILAGYHQPDDDGAEAWVNGEPITLGDGQAATAAGVRFVHQDLGLVGTLNSVENIAITRRVHDRASAAASAGDRKRSAPVTRCRSSASTTST